MRLRDHPLRDGTRPIRRSRIREALDRTVSEAAATIRSIFDLPRLDAGCQTQGWTREELYDEMLGR